MRGHDPAFRSAGALLLAALLWSSGGLLIKLIHWHPLALAGARSLVASLVFALVLGKFPRPRSHIHLIGAFCYALVVVLFVVSTKWTTAANAILLQYTAPAYVAVFGYWYLGEKPRPVDWLTLLAALLGIGLFFKDQLTLSGFLGNLLALASGVAFAWFALILRKQKAQSPLEIVFLGNLLAAFICLPFLFRPLPNAGGLAGILILGVFQLALPYILFTYAIQHVPAIEAVLIPYIEPILNPVWVFLVLGERPGPWALVGGAIVLAAVILRSLLMLGERAGRSGPAQSQ
ncbi:MAG: EamA/RhaT family transporter [Calditrichaeota bacterium]|nr:MAG: EamA/RhaT family transporter [Calditrichota bacterium]